MKTQTLQSFSEIIKAFEYQFDLRTVFSDFLTLCICSFSQNPITQKSHYEDEYLQTIEPYKKSKLCDEFPNLLASLILEMEERSNSSEGNDILGNFYENNLYRKGASQYFTPYPISQFMANISMGEANEKTDEPKTVIDPCCGSGRMLLASAQYRIPNQAYEFYGIDLDPICVKMTTINLFLNGLFHSEVMQANALDPSSFEISYRISFLPFGIFKIIKREDSPLWNRHYNSFHKEKENMHSPIEFTNQSDLFKEGNTQLRLF